MKRFFAIAVACAPTAAFAHVGQTAHAHPHGFEMALLALAACVAIWVALRKVG